MRTLHSHHPDQTTQWAKRLGALLEPGDVIGLEGPLGAGKTWFVQGLAQGLGIPLETEVRSPSFALIHEYKGRLPVYHVDLYRLNHAQELQELGLWELAESHGVLIVEWLSLFPKAIPAEYVQIEIAFAQQEHARDIHLTPHGERYKKLLSLLDDSLLR